MRRFWVADFSKLLFEKSMIERRKTEIFVSYCWKGFLGQVYPVKNKSKKGER